MSNCTILFQRGPGQSGQDHRQPRRAVCGGAGPQQGDHHRRQAAQQPRAHHLPAQGLQGQRVSTI